MGRRKIDSVTIRNWVHTQLSPRRLRQMHTLAWPVYVMSDISKLIKSTDLARRLVVWPA